MKFPLGPVTGLVLACVALTACEKKADEHAKGEDAVLATVDGQKIRQSDVNEIYDNLPPQYKQLPIEFLQGQMVEGLITQKLEAEAARKADFDKDPAYKARIARAQEQMLGDMWLNKEVDKALTPERLKKAYEADPKREVKASHILVKTEDEAKAIIAQLDKGGDFAAIAKEKSLDPGSGAAGGELGYFQPDQMVPEFGAAVTKLQPGETTKEPVKTNFGWHVIKVEDSRVVPFAEIEPKLREQEGDKVREELLGALRAKAKIEKPEPKAETPANPAAPPAPPAPGETSAPASTK